MSVGLCCSFHWHILKKLCGETQNFTKFTVHVTCDRGSVFLLQLCDVFCTSALWMMQCFHNRPCDMLSAFLSDNSKTAASILTKFCSQIAISKYWLRVLHYWAKSAINDCHVYWYATVRVVHGAVLGSERVVREASSSTARARCLQFRMTVSLRRHWNVSGTEPASRWWSKISGLASTVLHQCSSSLTAVDTET